MAKCEICWKFIDKPIVKGIYIYNICSKECFAKFVKKEMRKEKKKWKKNGRI